jgi:MauM/NapG family ferredoxin protein
MPDPDDINPLGRRGFFGDALREAMGPLSNLLEKKVNPLLRAIEELPNEVDRVVGSVSLDQLHAGGQKKRLPLPVAPAHVLRPPGALGGGGAEFEAVCSQCGQCAAACPANAIKISPGGGGDGGRVAGGYPYIVPADRPCVLCDELACMKACPTGALRPLDKLRVRIGTAKVEHGACLRSHGEDCRLCVDACPVEGAIVIGESGKVRVKKNVCTGCGLCENVCPTDPRAVTVRPARGDVTVV